MSENLFGELSEVIIAGDDTTAAAITQKLLDAEEPAKKILDEGLMPGMNVVGKRFRENIIFVPEVLVSARAMKASMSLLEPILSASNIKETGTIVLGTVKGDIHDIGKNMVARMLEVNGFEVTDLGTDVSVADFLSTARNQSADIIAMSSLLTTSLPYVKDVISILRETGEKENFKIIVGGGPVTDEWAKENGADGYGKNAADAVTISQALMSTF